MALSAGLHDGRALGGSDRAKFMKKAPDPMNFVNFASQHASQAGPPVD